MTLREPGPSRVTLSAVARHAGVSLATASKVLNRRDGVGSETRLRVEAVMNEVGYVPPGARTPGEVPFGGATLTVLVDSLLNLYTSE
jgi:LacI family transcriptional regulator